jgi:hypothetical protein
MDDKSKVISERARSTLNALVAGGHFPKSLLQSEEGKMVLKHEMLREVELQLWEYYQTWPYPAPRPNPDKV